MNKSGHTHTTKQESMAKAYNDFLWFQQVGKQADEVRITRLTVDVQIEPVQIEPVKPDHTIMVAVSKPVAEEPLAVHAMEEPLPAEPLPAEQTVQVAMPEIAPPPALPKVLRQLFTESQSRRVPNRRALWEGMVGAQTSEESVTAVRLEEAHHHLQRFLAWQQGGDLEAVGDRETQPLADKQPPVESVVEVTAALPSSQFKEIETDSLPPEPPPIADQLQPLPSKGVEPLLHQFAQQKRGSEAHSVFSHPTVAARYATRSTPAVSTDRLSMASLTAADTRSPTDLALEDWIGLSLEALSSLAAQPVSVDPPSATVALTPGRLGVDSVPFRSGWPELAFKDFAPSKAVDELEDLLDDEEEGDDLAKAETSVTETTLPELDEIPWAAALNRGDESQRWAEEDELDDAALEAEMGAPFTFETLESTPNSQEVWHDFQGLALPEGLDAEGAFQFLVAQESEDSASAWESALTPDGVSITDLSVAAVLESVEVAETVEPVVAHPHEKSESVAKGVVFTAFEVQHASLLLDEKAEESVDVIENSSSISETSIDCEAMAGETSAVVDERPITVDEILAAVDEAVDDEEDTAVLAVEEPESSVEAIVTADEEGSAVLIVEEPESSVDPVLAKRQKLLADILQLSEPVSEPSELKPSAVLAAVETQQYDVSNKLVRGEDDSRSELLAEILASSTKEGDWVTDLPKDQAVARPALSSVPPLEEGEFWEEVPVENLSRGVLHMFGDGFGLIARSIKSIGRRRDGVQPDQEQD